MPEDNTLEQVSPGQPIKAAHHNQQTLALEALRAWRDDPVAARVTGGPGDGDDLRLRSTSHPNKGHVLFGEAGLTAYDEANDRLGVGTPNPGAKLDVQGTMRATGFQLQDGTQQSGHVLTSDVNGVGTWQPLEGGGVGSHTHDASDIVSGTLPVARGGTGKSTIASNSLLYATSSNVLGEVALGSTLSVTSNVIDARLEVSKAGGDPIGTRKRLNFIEDGTATVTVTDVPGSDRVDVKIAATGGGGSTVVDIGLCQGRLSLVTGTPIPTSDQAAKTRVYFTPYLGNRIALYISGAWDVKTFSEDYVDLSGLTSGQNYDLYAYWDGSQVQLEIDTGASWGPTRSSAPGPGGFQDGVPTKSGDATRRWLGFLRASGTTTTEDTDLKRFVFNFYNRVPRRLHAKPSSASPYVSNSTTSWVAVPDTKVEFLTDGQQNLEILGTSLLDGVSNCLAILTIGTGSTTPATDASVASHSYNNAADSGMASVVVRELPLAGYHARNLILRSSTSGNTAYARNDTPVASVRPLTVLGALLPC